MDFLIQDKVLIQYNGPGGDIVISDEVDRIGRNCFARHPSLISVTLPKGVTAVEDCAFYGCDRLTRLLIPEAAPTIAPNALEFCGGLRRVTAPRLSADRFGTLFVKNCAAMGFLSDPDLYTAPEAVESYRRHILVYPRMMLPRIFAEDLDNGLSVYALHNAITADNFESHYLEPALAAHAVRCTAFLLDLKGKMFPDLPQPNWNLH